MQPCGDMVQKVRFNTIGLKILWHKIFLFQNMLPSNAFIKVAFKKSLVGKFVSNPKFPKKLVPETWAWISLLL